MLWTLGAVAMDTQMMLCAKGGLGRRMRVCLRLRESVMQSSVCLSAANVGNRLRICHGEVSIELRKRATPRMGWASTDKVGSPVTPTRSA